MCRQTIIGLFIVFLVLAPVSTEASIFSNITNTASAETDAVGGSLNSQKMPVFSSSSQIGPTALLADTTDTIDVVTAADALTPSMGPVGNVGAISDSTEGTDVTTYTVRAGDTVASIATLFDLSRSTIMSNNKLSAGQALKAGTVLTILPTDGYLYTIAKGDTLKKIAAKYKVDQNSIAFYNDVGFEDVLDIGDTLIIPDAVFTPAPITPNRSTGSTLKNIFKSSNTKLASLGGYLARPLASGVGRFVRGLHGARHSGIDIAAPIGTPIYAAASGTVRIAMSSGYNTGYGKYVMIDHSSNGVAFNTVYGHMSKVLVSPGQSVVRGQVIGLVGSTGRSTGAHVHFEVNGAINPLGIDPNYGN